MEFPHSLGLLYSAFTAFLGFEVNEGEYKVMGMAPYGQPRYVDKVWKVVQQNPTVPSPWIWITSPSITPPIAPLPRRFEALFGEPRPTKLNFFTEGTGFPKYFGDPPSNYHELCKLNQHYRRYRGQYSESDRRIAVGHGRNLQNRPA